jgi:hypothetical protein
VWKVIAISTAVGDVDRRESRVFRKPALMCTCSREVIDYRQLTIMNSELTRLDSKHSIALVGSGSKKSRKKFPLPVTRLSWTHGLWNCSCNRQLAQLDGDLSNLIDAAIDSLRVLVWIRGNWLRPTWSLTRPLADWLLNQLGIVSATVNINLVYFPSLVASATCPCQFRTISP